MSNDNTKEAMPFLLSDTECATIAYKHGGIHDYLPNKNIVAREVRDIYEQARQRDKERIEELTRDRDNLRNFIDALIQDVCWGRGMPDDMDGGSVQDMAERMGVLVQVPHALPCDKEACGCEGEDVDFLYNTPWNITPSTQ